MKATGTEALEGLKNENNRYNLRGIIRSVRGAFYGLLLRAWLHDRSGKGRRKEKGEDDF